MTKQDDALYMLFEEDARGRRRLPLGWALRKCFEDLANLPMLFHDGRIRSNGEAALQCWLAWHDLQSLVILGDPVVAFPIPRHPPGTSTNAAGAVPRSPC